MRRRGSNGVGDRDRPIALQKVALLRTTSRGHQPALSLLLALHAFSRKQLEHCACGCAAIGSNYLRGRVAFEFGPSLTDYLLCDQWHLELEHMSTWCVKWSKLTTIRVRKMISQSPNPRNPRLQPQTLTSTHGFTWFILLLREIVHRARTAPPQGKSC